MDLCKLTKLLKVVASATKVNLFQDPMGVQIHKNYIVKNISRLAIVHIGLTIMHSHNTVHKNGAWR